MFVHALQERENVKAQDVKVVTDHLDVASTDFQRRSGDFEQELERALSSIGEYVASQDEDFIDSSEEKTQVRGRGALSVYQMYRIE